MKTRLLILWLLVLTLPPASLSSGSTDGIDGLEIIETQIEIEWEVTFGGTLLENLNS